MKKLNQFITEYIIKKKLDHPINSNVTDVYEEIDDLIDLDNYDKKIRDCVKKWIDQFDVKSIVYYTINKRLLERYLDISLIEDKLMSEDEFQQMKANSSSDFIPIDLIKTPKVTVKTCSNYIYMNFQGKRYSLYIIFVSIKEVLLCQ